MGERKRETVKEREIERERKSKRERERETRRVQEKGRKGKVPENRCAKIVCLQ